MVSHRREVDYLKESTLKPVSGRLPLVEYVKAIVSRGPYILLEARYKAFSSNRSLWLGHLWYLIDPVLDIAIYGIVFGLLLNTSNGIEYYVLYLAIGVIFYRQASNGLSGGVGLIRARKNFIKAFAFPRACIIISKVLTNRLNTMPQTIVVFLICAFFPGGPGISPTMLLFPLILPLMYLFQLGCCFFSATLTHLVPDASKVITVFMRFWFYSSGVFYGVNRFSQFPTLEKVIQFNPALQLLKAYRDVLIYSSVPSLKSTLIIVVWSILGLLVGFIYFWWNEAKYARF